MTEATPVTVYTAPRKLDPQWLRAGDQILIGDTWSTVTERLSSDASSTVVVRVHDLPVPLPMPFRSDGYTVRIPVVAETIQAVLYTAVLDLPVEYVQPGWLFQLGQQWHEVTTLGARCAECERDGCRELGFVGDVSAVLGELLDAGDDLDADASDPDGMTWLHLHTGDTVAVRIPCEVPA